ncbi:MAG: hypothetical protein GQ527_08560, partial [Bacteroidales bacterium]|nr:hypothetical protein [Bacteroidales bacterium]
KAHGINYTITSKKKKVEVEYYQFEKQKWASRSFEGRQNLQSFGLKADKKEFVYEPGAMLIPVNQRLLKVLVYLLEPKADNSLASWGFFNSMMERKEYAETYVMEKMAREMIAENPALLDEFETWRKEHPEVLKNQWAQTMWFFEKTPFWDQEKDIYPVGRIFDQKVMFELGVH